MRLSLMKAARVAFFGTAYRKYGYRGTRHLLRGERPITPNSVSLYFSPLTI